MGQTAVGWLRAVIVIMVTGLVVAQVVVLPLLGAAVVADAPEVSVLRWWILAGGIAVLATVQVALVCVWRLLTMVRRDIVFSVDALRFVDGILAAVVAATVLVTAMNILLSAVHVNPPLVFLTLAGGTVGGAGLALLLAVMRALLSQAAGLRHELSEVV